MRIVCISDTHNRTADLKVPDGDLLIHAGDLTMRGTLDELRKSRQFLDSLPHPNKVIIAGNHDWGFEKEPEAVRALFSSFTYLQDQETTVAGLRIWGSPWQPWFFDWAFNLDRGPAIRSKWDLIPDGIDVLVTHGPPAGHGDRNMSGESVGCSDLLEVLTRIRPRLHVFGHIHEGYGESSANGVRFVNASICTFGYHPTNPAIVIDL